MGGEDMGAAPGVRLFEPEALDAESGVMMGMVKPPVLLKYRVGPAALAAPRHRLRAL
jgi:hypothetical protein